MRNHGEPSIATAYAVNGGLFQEPARNMILMGEMERGLLAA
jgi:hypothetical protein